MWLKLDNIPDTLHEDQCTFVSLVFIMDTVCVVCGVQSGAEEAFMIETWYGSTIDSKHVEQNTAVQTVAKVRRNLTGTITE